MGWLVTRDRLFRTQKCRQKPGGRLSTRSKTGTNRCREHSATALGSAYAPLRRGYFFGVADGLFAIAGRSTDRQRGRAAGGGEGALTEQNNRLTLRVFGDCLGRPRSNST